MLETEKAASIAQCTLDAFVTQIKSNNMSVMITSYATPITACNTLIPYLHLDGMLMVEGEIVLELLQQGPLIIETEIETRAIMDD
ncbi:uncharacterized protein DS421_12g375620 [Arachis hypogaea]|nr:uncharacterized protein DS421_12g375620 [Arachis hypogaea]